MNKESINSPLISVLMTSYNCGKYIEEAIQSILNQTYTNWELLIADDCSHDNTRGVINKFNDDRIRIFHNDENMHYLRTRNKLVQHVEGDYITLLDADDLCTKNRLQLLLDTFLNDDKLSLCGSHVSYINEKGKSLDIIDKKPLSYEEVLSRIRKENVFTGSSIMVKTTVWKEFQGYRDYFSSLGYEDYDLTSRIVEKYKAINLEDQLYIYRQYPDSTSKKNLMFNPFKLHGDKLVQSFIRQRANGEIDKLKQNDIPWIINYIVSENKPYIEDASLIYRHMTWSYLNKGMSKRAFKFLLKALFIRPLSLKNIKLLILFILIQIGVRS